MKQECGHGFLAGRRTRYIDKARDEPVYGGKPPGVNRKRGFHSMVGSRQPALIARSTSRSSLCAMPAKPTSVKDYLAMLPADRRRVIEAIRRVVRLNIDKEFEEGLQYGMLAWYLPHSKYPKGYHCDPEQPLPFASIASQKNHIGIYLFCIYGNSLEQARFAAEWKAAGKRLDMGKSCVRVKKLGDVPLEVIGRAFKRMTAKKFVKGYKAMRKRWPSGVAS
ncbi:MAG: DUF1801 domain-containing protein [Acidobacteriota bacterium]